MSSRASIENKKNIYINNNKMLTTIDSVERQLKWIPPYYDQYLILTSECRSFAHRTNNIKVFASGWTRQEVAGCLLGSNATIIDWKLTDEVNNAPTAVYIPSNMYLAVDVVYYARIFTGEMQWCKKIINVENNGEEGITVNLESIILEYHELKEEKPYLYFGYVTKPIYVVNEFGQKEYDNF